MSLAHKKSLSRTALSFVSPAALLMASLLTSGVASAASMQGPVSGWQQGNEPNNMSMYIYVPDNVADNAPILVALHYCGGTASAIYGAANSGGVISAANQQGFIILFPQTSRNCWDVGTTASLTNGGGSDTLSIVHQVEYVVSQYGGNADRVYAMGQSGGAMAVQGLLAVYPDVFKGGAEFSGVPAGCWAVDNMTDGQWSSKCANGEVTHTAQEWGDMVRNMYPGYTGKFRPRMQLWHGTGDGTIKYQNQTEAIKQWTNVLGLSDTPSATSNVTVNGKTFNREEYKDECGMTVLDVMNEPGGPHNTSATMTAQYTLAFMGLDGAGAGDAEDPQAASDCWMDGGNTGTGGAGSGGADGTGGVDAGTGGAITATGGANTGTGGALSGTGGALSGTGGALTGTGGANPGTGGALVGTGGTLTSTGGTNAGTGGAPLTGTGGSAPGTGGAIPGTGATGTDGGAGQSSGCAINVRNTSAPMNALALAGLFVAMFARRRYKRSARVS